MNGIDAVAIATNDWRAIEQRRTLTQAVVVAIRV